MKKLKRMMTITLRAGFSPWYEVLLIVGKSLKMPHRIKSWLIHLLISVSAALCSTGCRQPMFIPDASFPQADVTVLPLLIPTGPADPVYGGLSNSRAVIRFYQIRGQRPGWVDEERTYALGDSLIRFISDIRLFGLLPQHYHIDKFNAGGSPWWRPEVLIRRDVLLTDAFLSLVKDLEYGRLRRDDPGSDSVAIRHLARVLADGSLARITREVESQIPQYQFLKNRLRALIFQADSTERTLLLQGLTVDSSSLHNAVRNIEINLERWRWENRAWEGRYVFVNIPSFALSVMDNDSLVFLSRAIVGKPEKATPEFTSMIQCFVTYPYWNVPRKISVEELLPVIQRDTTFIHRNNFDVLDRGGNVLNPDSVDWKKFHKDNFPVVLRQREGPENSLGVVKFIFDNPYAVFIHDTNAPRLFRHKSRAFSHGCIRVEKVRALGHYLVTGRVGEKSPVLESYLEQKLRHQLDLAEPVPVHIRYFTAAEQNGELIFFDDIYFKDRALIDSLYGESTILSRK